MYFHQMSLLVQIFLFLMWDQAISYTTHWGNNREKWKISIYKFVIVLDNRNASRLFLPCISQREQVDFLTIYSFLSYKIYLVIDIKGCHEIWHRWKRTNFSECVYINTHLWEIIDTALKLNTLYVFKFRIFINI